MYSIGNEVSETASPKVVELCALLAEYVRSLDSTRSVNCGINVLLNVYANKGMGVCMEKSKSPSLWLSLV
jgi:beta-galactosidase